MLVSLQFQRYIYKKLMNIKPAKLTNKVCFPYKLLHFLLHSVIIIFLMILMQDGETPIVYDRLLHRGRRRRGSNFKGWIVIEGVFENRI